MPAGKLPTCLCGTCKLCRTREKNRQLRDKFRKRYQDYNAKYRNERYRPNAGAKAMDEKALEWLRERGFRE